MSTTLVRTPLDQLTASDSRSMLIAKAVALMQGKALPSLTPLREALAKLAINPLDPLLVAAYKKEKQRNTVQWSNGTIAGFFVCLILSVLPFICAAMARMSPHGSDKQDVFIGATILTLVLGPTIGWYNWFDNKTNRRIVTDWTRHNLAKAIDANYHDYYSRDQASAFDLADMPDFAIDRFIAVKTACPSASFFVDALHTKDSFDSSRAQLRREADPFLVACMGDEEFYLDVWDEPQFERTI